MARFDISADRMAVNGNLDAEAEKGLRAGIRQLLDGGASSLTVDLSGVDAITSICIGVLVVMCLDVRAAGKKMKIIASPGVKKVLDMTGLAAMLLG